MKKEEITKIKEKVNSRFESQYRIKKTLGSGGMGCVFYICSAGSESNEYALKVLDKRIYEKNKLNWMGEAQVLQKLNHPGIPAVYEVTEDEHYGYLIQEFISGIPLSRVLREKGKIDGPELSDWMEKTAEILCYLHHEGFIHRDIKPDNLMLTKDQSIKIIDFGLAREDKQFDSADKRVFGTLSYTAPERFRRVAANAQTDIYGYGATMYQLTTGQKPENMKSEPDESYKIMKKNLQNSEEPLNFRIIEKALAVSPDYRYVSFDKVLWDLEHKDQMITVEVKENDYHWAVIFIIFTVLFLMGLWTY